MTITKGLIIDSPPIDRILAGEKTWEMRSTATKQRGRIGLIRKGSGLVVGTAEIVDSRGPLSRSDMILNFDHHRIEPARIESGAVDKWKHAWVLRDVRKLSRPVPYSHPAGAVIWVTLDAVVGQTVAAQYLRRRLQEIPGLTNVSVAQALDYPKPNVVAMMLNGTMKVPVSKVPALARVLEVDPVALLRRVLLAYAPELWTTIDDVIGHGRLISANEAELLRHVREHLGAEDVALVEDPKFAADVAKLLLAALDRHTRVMLARRRTERPARDSKAGRENTAMLELLRKQATERAQLMRTLGADSAG